MARYVDADKIMQEYKADGNWDLHKVLKKTPTADVRENVRGEWEVKYELMDKRWAHFCGYEEGEEPKYDKRFGYYVCSACGERPHGEPMNFCPNCGAYMRGGEE